MDKNSFRSVSCVKILSSFASGGESNEQSKIKHMFNEIKLIVNRPRFYDIDPTDNYRKICVPR